MEVRFREIDPFNCWIWLRFSEVPGQGEKNYIDGVFDILYCLKYILLWNPWGHESTMEPFKIFQTIRMNRKV